MKWLNKFQDGGKLRQVIGSLTSLVKRAQNKDTEAIQQIKAILEDIEAAPMLDMIRKTVPDLIEAMEGIAQSVSFERNGGAMYLKSLKCGGKAKKKVKKSEDGQKLEATPARLAKGKKLCPCSLKKIGGRIVEVDCDGNIVWNKNGGYMVVKAQDGLTIGDSLIPGFSAYNLKTKDDILKMTGMSKGDVQHYYDPTTKSVQMMTYGDDSWGDPSEFTLAEGQTYGTGDGQINLWRDGYNLQTGLMPNQQVKRDYGYGVTGMTNTRAETNSPLVRGDDGNLRLQYGKGKDAAGNDVTYDNSSVNLTYSPAQMARMMRAQRKADYWANREAGVAKDVAKNEQKLQRRMDRNTVYGIQYNDYGSTGYKQNSADGDYQSLYRSNKKRQAAEAKLAAPVGDVIQSNNPTQTTTATNASTAGPVTVKKAASRLANGGWLQKYGNGGYIPKHGLGDLLNKMWGKVKHVYKFDPVESFNGIKTSMAWDLVNDPLLQKPWPYTTGKVIDGLQKGDGKRYHQYPTGLVSTINTDKRLNAQFDENNRQKEFEESLQDPSMLPGETQMIQEAMARNAEYDAQQAARKLSPEQIAFAKARSFYNKLGSQGITDLQTNLRKLGYNVDVDGKFGNQTYNAVMEMQRRSGLTSDGMAGANTMGKMNELLAGFQTKGPVSLQTTSLPSGSTQQPQQGTYMDPTKGEIRTSRTVDGITEYNVNGVWVGEGDLTQEQLDHYNKGRITSPRTVYGVSTTGVDQSKMKKPVVTIPSSFNNSMITTPQEYMSTTSPVFNKGGWLNKKF